MSASEEIRGFYEAHYRSEAEKNPAHEIYDDLRIRAIKTLSSTCPGPILIAGCGSGKDLEVSPPDHQVVAFDLSREAVSKINAGSSLIFVGNVRRMPFKDGQFNLVICSEVLEHVVEISSAVSELRRVIKPGGALVVSSPNRHSLFGLARWVGEKFFKRPFHSSGQPYDDWKTFSQYRAELEPYFDIRGCRGVWYLPPMHYKKHGLPRLIVRLIYWIYSPGEILMSRLFPKLGHLLVLRCEPYPQRESP